MSTAEPRYRKNRRGFSMIDLCVICAVLIVLLTLLVPFVNEARAVAQQSGCRDNLKKIGLALHNYHDTHRVFPPGWVTAYQHGESYSGYGWQTFILPFLDQAPLFNNLNLNMPVARPDVGDKLTGMWLTRYVCPQSGADRTNRFRGRFGTSTYSGNYGSYRPPRWSDGRVEAFWPGAVPTAWAPRTPQSSSRSGRQAPQAPPVAPAEIPDVAGPIDYGRLDGIFSWNSSTNLRDVTDGFSNTLMVGERAAIGHWGIWVGVGANRFETDAVTDCSHQSPINRSLSGFSSNHNGGFYTALMDGSVVFLSEDIDSSPERGVFQAIASKNGNEVFPGDVFRKNGF